MNSPFTQQSTDLTIGLNEQQKAAVEHSGSPLLIVAGAGSGKTAAHRRIAHLMRERGVAPWEILAITFTNKAAAEMRERVTGLVGPVAERMWVATFHSVCVRILRQQAQLVPGLNTNFTIYDADDSRRLLSMIAKDHNLDLKKFTARVLANAISNLKNELIDPESAAADAAVRNPFDITVAEVYADYQRRLRAASAVDSTISSVRCGSSSSTRDVRPLPAAFPARAHREYQDTNFAQYMLVATLVGTGPAPQAVCVGDSTSRSTLPWGDDPQHRGVQRDYPQARTILEQNYRSTQILNAANAVISRNDGRRRRSCGPLSARASRSSATSRTSTMRRFIARKSTPSPTGAAPTATWP